MTIPYPLGVRIYSPPTSFDMWVTPNVENFVFRSGVPGGFLDASIKFHRYAPIGQPDATVWTPTTSAVSTDNQSFKVLDANAALINAGDRFWVYNGSGIRMNGDRFTVTGKSSAGGTTTVSYAPSSSVLIASGDTVIAKVPASFYDTSLLGFNRMVALFNRLQIVDLRSAEIAWEGRIEDPARESEKDTWTLGVIGTTVFANDIRRPMFYLDDQVDSWKPTETIDYTPTSDASTSTLKITWANGSAHVQQALPSPYMASRGFFHQMVAACDLEGVGRWDAICNGGDMSSTVGKLALTLYAIGWDDTVGTTPTDQANIARYPLNGTTDFHVAKQVGTHIYWPVNRLNMRSGYLSNTGTDAIPAANTWGSWRLPRVQSVRMDRYRNKLNTGASYPDGALKPGPVVEDVLGRFLNGGHDRQYADLPYAGYVDPYSAYVDTSSGILMVSGWTFYDQGVTGKEILDKICDEAQTTAYWAIWESSFNNTDDGFASKCKFEFVNWPLGWGYSLTSEDGLVEQPNGSNEYAYLWYQYAYDTNLAGSRVNYSYWNQSLNSELDTQQITRATFLMRDQDVSNGATIVAEASNFLDVNSRVKNSGTIKIGRPVPVYDPGVGRPNGMARLLDPWMVRPGKLAKIIDLEPKAMMNDFGHGNTAPRRETDGTVFRMVNTEFDTSTGICTVDLDQNASWSIPNQFLPRTTGRAGKGTYYR